MEEDKNLGLRKFRFNLDDYEKWKEEWIIVTNMIRLKAAKAGKDLSEIEIVGG